MSRRKIFWSELPTEILSSIAERLKLRSDVLHFRAVCRTWRKSAPSSLLTGKKSLSPILPHFFSIKPCNEAMNRGQWNFASNRLVLVANSVFLVHSIANPNFEPWLFSVEEFNPGKLYLRTPLKRTVVEHMPKGFPTNLDFSRFRVSEISRMYSLSFDPSDSSVKIKNKKNRVSQCFDRVVLHVNSDKCDADTVAIDDCTLMVLYYDSSVGSFGKISLRDRQFSVLECCSIKKFDDVVSFKGKVLAIDRKGKLYEECNGMMSRITDVPETEGGLGIGLGGDRKKRLVKSCGELYLVYRCSWREKVAFKVFKLADDGKMMKWEQLEGIGDDRIIVATHDGCFFVPSKDIPSWPGNSLVFVRGVFPAYDSIHKADLELFKSRNGPPSEIAIYNFGSGTCKVKVCNSPKVLWPPPAWLSSDPHLPNSSSHMDEEEEEEEKGSLVQNCRESSSINENTSTPEFQGDSQVECISPLDIQENLPAEDAGALDITMQIQPNTTIFIDSTPTTTICDNAITECYNVISKSPESDVAKTKFQGVDVSSDLIPTLKAIWAKHGNILEGNRVQSNVLVAWALESLAKMVILLQNTSGGSLDNSQADYLSSTLCDLQLMQLNVDWLASSVAKVLKLQKARTLRAEMKDTLSEIDKVKTLVTDFKLKFLAELSGLEQMLDEKRKMVHESLCDFNCLDSSSGFGEGLC